jgi:alkylhydroperoxidase family enzyme
MARVSPVDVSEAADAARVELARQLAAHGRLTNMKRTLAREPAALTALMMWYPLRDAVAAFLGDRTTILFAHAVSVQTECLICSTFFRRLLLDAGDDPDALTLDALESAIVEYGRRLGRDANDISDDDFARLAAFLRPEQIVALTAFGGMMIATNVFNNALQVDLDEYLWPFRKGITPVAR